MFAVICIMGKVGIQLTSPILEVNRLKKYFYTSGGIVHAVDDVSFFINEGKTLGLVGESGCGKSTLGRVIIRLIEATSGSVKFRRQEVLSMPKKELRKIRKEMQIIFQDPYSSLDPRKSIGDAIGKPLQVHGLWNKKKREKEVDALMKKVGLSPNLYNKYPHELDGGQRQRVGIARALALNPSFIVCDEPVSSLDVSIQAQILNLLEELQDELGLTYLFIAHDLSVIKHISDRVVVMYLGKIVEAVPTNELFSNPVHPYTQALLAAIPIPKLKKRHKRIILEGSVPSPINLPSGCRFNTRCFKKKSICSQKNPELKEIGPDHQVACHLI